jgi:outer membrane lipoprotein carrier protein
LSFVKGHGLSRAEIDLIRVGLRYPLGFERVSKPVVFARARAARLRSCPVTKLAVIAAALLVAAIPLFAQDVHAIAAKVDQRYDHMRTLEARFTETYSGAGMTRTESGSLQLRKPGEMRWDYDQPRPKLFITDGKVAWFYVPGERQARRTPVKDLDDLRSPLRYLLGKTKLDKELDGLSLAPDQKPLQPGDWVLRGIPKGMQDRVSQTLLEISPDGLIVRIMVEELDGSVTDFRFLQQKENVQIAEQQFHFVPPPGVEIVAGTEME